MAHIYMHFDFGADEEKAQQARHKLDVWKQAFRLDKKLQYKLDRPREESDQDAEPGVDASHTGKDTEKPKSRGKKQARKVSQTDTEASGVNGNVSLLVRLYFSSHEKLSGQRWLDRIPTEEPFKSASPQILRQGEAGFEEALKQFADLD